jgi:hypothetical protein
LDAAAYDRITECPKNKHERAFGITIADVDNDGDMDIFLCNGGDLWLNRLNPLDTPATPTSPPNNNRGKQNYLNVMCASAAIDRGTYSTYTKDGVGTRVYLYSYAGRNPAAYDSSNMVGMREIDGGSGYGSQATQVQHFGLDDCAPGGTKPWCMGTDPHKKPYTLKAIFSTGEVVWKYRVVPDKERVNIVYNGGADTTVLEQTVEIIGNSNNFQYQIIR